MKNCISVIIPMYNAAEYIQECIESVLNQTLNPYEIIVVDDGSTDMGWKNVKLFPNVKLISQANSGVTAARRKGVEAATGEWIYFMDADDTLPPIALERLSAGCASHVDMIVGTRNKEQELSRDGFVAAILQNEIPIGPTNKLYRRILFDDAKVLAIPREIVRGEDLLMLIRLSNTTLRKVALVICTEYNYRSHAGQVTKTFATNSGYESMYYNFLKQSLSEADRNKFQPLLIKTRITALCHIICRQIETQDYGVKQTDWFKELQGDMESISYQPTLWEYLILHVANSENIKWLFRLKRLFNRIKHLTIAI